MYELTLEGGTLLLTLPKTSTPAPRTNERAPLWCTVSCRAVPHLRAPLPPPLPPLLPSLLSVDACGVGAHQFSRFHFVFACLFLRRRLHVCGPLSACFCPKSKSKRSTESGFRVTESADALSALRRLNRRISRRRCSLNRDALEIRRFLSEDRPEVSVAKAVCVTKPKRQQEC